MNSFRRNKERRSRSLLIATVLVLLLVITDVVTGGILRNGVRASAAGLTSLAGSAVRSVELSGFFSSKSALATENAMLKERIDELEALQIENDIYKSENKVLRDLLVVAQEHPDGVSATVRTRPDMFGIGTFVISLGSNSGVQEGDYVVGTGSVALGAIEEVTGETALVSLFSAPLRETEVAFDDAAITAIGRGGSNMLVNLPRDTEIEEGDLITLPDSPLAVGVVGHVEVEPVDATKQVLIRVPYPLDTLRFVRVVRVRFNPEEL